MKLIKKIAFGTMTSAFCLFSYFGNVAKADRVDLSASGGAALQFNGNSSFGMKKGDYSKATTKDAKKKETDANQLGIGDTIGFRIMGSAGYIYDINEYVGIGGKFGFGVVRHSATVAGKDYSTQKVTEGTASALLVQLYPALELMVYPLGEPSLLLGVAVGAKLNVMGDFANEAQKNGDKAPEAIKAHVTKDNIKSKTNAQKKLFQVGTDLFIGYDFRDLMDFPLTLGLEGSFTFLDLYKIERSTKTAVAKDSDSLFGKVLKKKDEDGKDYDIESPSVAMSVALKLGVDVGYYIFGA